MTAKPPYKDDNTELRTEIEKLIVPLVEVAMLGNAKTPTVPATIDQLLALFSKTIATKTKEARIKARSKLLLKLIRTYSLIAPPIKESPMELTDEAKYYNKFAKDLHKFVELEFAKHEALKPPTGGK